MFDKDLITGSGRGGPSLSAQPPADGETRRPWSIVESVERSHNPKWNLEEPENLDDVAVAVQSSYVGIMWAGGAFGACLFLILVLVDFLYNLPSFSFGIGEVFGGLFLSSIAGLFGFVVATISGGMSIAWVLGLNAMFVGLMSRRFAVALTGGLAAFQPIGATAFLSLVDPRLGVEPLSVEFFVFENLYPLFFLTLISFIAMVFGQVGALRAAKLKGVWRYLKQEMEDQQSLQIKSNHSTQSSCPKSSSAPFQFRIRHIMIIMIACSCVLAADQIFPNHALLAVTCLYFFLQSILLCFDIVFFK